MEFFQTKPRDLTVTARLYNQEITLLEDTGIGISVIEKKFLQDLYTEQVSELCTSNSAQVKTISGEALPILGTVRVLSHVAGGKYPCDYHVVRNLSYEAVLGRNFLRANSAVINLKNGTLQLEKSLETLSEDSCPVRVWSTCIVPSETEAFIPAYLDTNWSPGIVRLLEASPHLIECYQLQGATALVTLFADHTVSFRLINPTRILLLCIVWPHLEPSSKPMKTSQFSALKNSLLNQL